MIPFVKRWRHRVNDALRAVMIDGAAVTTLARRWRSWWRGP